jgi:hypothetical protein
MTHFSFKLCNDWFKRLVNVGIINVKRLSNTFHSQCLPAQPFVSFNQLVFTEHQCFELLIVICFPDPVIVTCIITFVGLGLSNEILKMGINCMFNPINAGSKHVKSSIFHFLVHHMLFSNLVIRNILKILFRLDVYVIQWLNP